MYSDEVKASPSLQHLAAHVGSSADVIAKNILATDPRFLPKTFKARKYASFLLSGQSAELAKSQAAFEPRVDVRKAALEMIPLIEDYMSEHSVRWFKKDIGEYFFQVTPTLIIPIKPLGIAYVDGCCRLIWPQHWKTKTLDPLQYQFWATIIKRAILDTDPDIEGFHWIEMSATDKRRQVRELRVRDEAAVDYLDDAKMLEIADDLERGLELVRQAPRPKPEPKKRPPDQLGLFD